jgi:hypothetical protein
MLTADLRPKQDLPTPRINNVQLSLIGMRNVGDYHWKPITSINLRPTLKKSGLWTPRFAALCF